MRQAFNHGYLGAQGSPQARELDSDNSAAEHHCLVGNPIKLQRLIGSDHSPLDFQTGQRLRIRAGSEYQVFPLVSLVANLDSIGADHSTPSLDVVDLAGFHQPL